MLSLMSGLRAKVKETVVFVIMVSPIVTSWMAELSGNRRGGPNLAKEVHNYDSLLMLILSLES